jgi:taurine dioxygenase
MTAVGRELSGTWDLRPLAGRVGVEVRGVDLRTPLTGEQAEDLRWILAEHGVVVFSGQQLDDDGHQALAAHLGEVKIPPDYLASLADEGHPEISVISTENGLAYTSDQWHADVTWMPDPPRYSILHMRVLPPAGGDTMWASQFEAFDRLSEPMKAFLRPLTATHARPHADEVNPHPVVIRHPLTGREGLFVNSVFTRRIVELGEQESAAVLSFLFEHGVQPECVCRWRWSVGDLGIWDNHFVQHYAINDYGAAARRIHRIEIKGQPPIPSVS